MAPRVPGFRASGVWSGVKAGGALDLALIASDRPASAAGVFTRSRVVGAPVIVSRARVRKGRARAIVTNSGVSNVANGARGVADARAMTAAVARELGVLPSEVLVSSTGVIGRPLPIEKILKAVPDAAASLSEGGTGWRNAAQAILTTDLKRKLVHAKSRGFSMLGIAKGSGMIMPNMATMLAYVVTDLAVEPALLRAVLREAIEPTFNRLTIDGQTSTSDTVLLLANGAAGNRPLESGSRRTGELRGVLGELCRELCEGLAIDGEGVTRLADVRVTGARNDDAADRVARHVANSALFKTALHGADPNPGRIVQAVGAAGVALRQRDLDVSVGGTLMYQHGEAVGGQAAIARAERAMKKRRVAVHISIGAGPGTAEILTTDLSAEYVRINSEYTS